MIEILCRENGPVHRALTGTTLAVTDDRARAQKSLWAWREEQVGEHRYYRLSPLGVLHRLIGLQLRVVRLKPNPPEREVI